MLAESTGDGDSVVDRVAARVPVGHREPDGERRRGQTARTASTTSSGKRSRSARRGVRQWREEAGEQAAVGHVELEHVDAS